MQRCGFTSNTNLRFFANLQNNPLTITLISQKLTDSNMYDKQTHTFSQYYGHWESRIMQKFVSKYTNITSRS
ncbi:MAG: hypothetical protein D6730_23845 [Bacteroidetes bacterium]|nr:MAG: hypothetical protein D6730_23845 [Bacteroidota bacterium]